MLPHAFRYPCSVCDRSEPDVECTFSWHCCDHWYLELEREQAPSLKKAV
jgi:hypothetical protein